MEKIISGGQSGADIAALDAAIKCGVPIGGYCPKNRESEVSIDFESYPLIEINGGYRQRTKENIKASEATVIFYNSEIVGGTELTLYFCIKSKTPYKLIDMSVISVANAANSINGFILKHKVKVLNVAGPSASRQPDIYSFVYSSMLAVLG
ncbi:TPA: hypothetical protein NJ173_004541 [Vibrio parahaemolyticus]|nr:hypothetical protein [Vibrio parahaemolyticus]